MMIVAVASAAEKTEWDKLAGQPVDIAPWAYVWRADRAVQEKPEAYFIPRRLDRIDKVYRTAYAALSPDRLKSIAYANQPDLLKPLPPKPKGQLLAGLLWTGRLHDYRVELHWPAERSADSVAGRRRGSRLSHGVGLVWVDRRSDSEAIRRFRRTAARGRTRAIRPRRWTSPTTTGSMRPRKWSRSSTTRERRPTAPSPPCRTSA